MNLVLIIGLLMNLIALPIVGRRLWFLFRLIRSGQPAPDRIEGVTGRLGRAITTEVVEVLGQRRLLKWTVPGLAHFFTFWAFMILGTVYVEAYGVLFGPDDWSIPFIGHWPVLGFVQDAIALAVLVSIVVFAVIRIRNAPKRLGRQSRFKGSHEFGAYLVLFFIFNVVWTLFLFRGAAAALGNFDNKGAFVSNAVGRLVDGLSDGTLHFLEGLGLLLHIGVMLVFLIEVVHSKHLHIMAAPINVLFKRQPIALGAARPLMAAGQPVTLDDLEELDEETTFGVGAVEQFAWKGILDFATCTECGRCQSQCPAWNTEKPLSPKLLIMNLRDHAYAKGPYLLADEGKRASLPAATLAEAERPLVGETEGDPWQPSGGAVIDNDVLWSCVTCGACVQQCPVDIEHVDHILDMRRYQVLVESSFPAELNGLFKGMENRGNPWNMAASARMEWAKGLDFDIPVVGEDLESLESVDWLFWVGCAGAYEDRAKKTTQAVAELLHLAGISFGVLGNGETCTGDSARRSGNEFVFQGLAQQNIETFRDFKVKNVVTTCAHCFNTLKNEYRQFGIELEVIHHTQLLNRLVREGKLTPMPGGPSGAVRKITYHDPCYLGRHNQVYAPPRELLQVLPGTQYVEMERNSERSFCCGAGGARMWMEETIGTRINDNRSAEAVATGAEQIAVACPFCRVMLDDGVTAQQAAGNAGASVQVLDVAQMLLASVKGEKAAAPAPAAAAPAAPATPVVEEQAEGTPVVEERAEGERLDTTAPTAPAPTTGSLFDVAPPPAAPPAPPSPAGGSLFDVAAPVAESAGPSGGSLFDVAAPEPTPATAPAPPSVPAGSLFDVPAPVAAPAPETPASAIPSGSLFDVAPPVVEERAEGEPLEVAAPADTPDTILHVDDVARVETPAPQPADTAAPLASGAAHHVPRTDIDIHGASSLFDIPAPAGFETLASLAPQPAEAPLAPQPADASLAPQPAAAPLAPQPAEQVAPTVDPETILDVDDAPPAPQPADAPPAPEPADAPPAPQPADAPPVAATASGDHHQPRTDIDIHNAGSLFDF